MGQSCAVVYANVYVFESEYELIEETVQSGSTLLYRRFIDDVFAILSDLHASSTFARRLNSLHPNLVFNCVESQNEVEFLNTVIFKRNRFSQLGILDLRVHQKITNRYLYIPFNSFHTHHNKVAWITAELSRYIRNTSSLSDYIEMKKKFYFRLRNRGYHPNFLLSVMNQVKFSQRSSMLETKISDNSDQVPLVFTSMYHPSVSHGQIKSALLQNWDLIKNNSELRDTFSEPPIVGYKRSQNIQQKLIESRYSRPPSENQTN